MIIALRVEPIPMEHLAANIFWNRIEKPFYVRFSQYYWVLMCCAVSSIYSDIFLVYLGTFGIVYDFNNAIVWKLEKDAIKDGGGNAIIYCWNRRIT